MDRDEFAAHLRAVSERGERFSTVDGEHGSTIIDAKRVGRMGFEAIVASQFAGDEVLEALDNLFVDETEAN